MTVYTQGQFIDFCHKVFGGYKLTNGGDNINVLCPFCAVHKPIGYSKQKLVVHTTTHVMHCWVCSYKSNNLIHILRKYFPIHEEQYKEKFHKTQAINSKADEIKQEEILKFPEGFTLLATANKKDTYNKTALDYLLNRKIDIDYDLWYWKLGVTTHDPKLINRVIIPSFNKEGEFNFFSARNFAPNKTKRKYQNPTCAREEIIFNELNIDWKKELIITEGAFDLMKCPSNSTCILGSDLSANYKLFREIVENKTPVILALDPDALNKTLNIAKRFNEFDISVKILEIPNNFNDVGEMTKQEFINIIDDAIVFDIDYSLKRKILNIV